MIYIVGPNSNLRYPCFAKRSWIRTLLYLYFPQLIESNVRKICSSLTWFRTLVNWRSWVQLCMRALLSERSWIWTSLYLYFPQLIESNVRKICGSLTWLTRGLKVNSPPPKHLFICLIISNHKCVIFLQLLLSMTPLVAMGLSIRGAQIQTV